MTRGRRCGGILALRDVLSDRARQMLAGFAVLELAPRIGEVLFDVASMRAPLDELEGLGLIIVFPRGQRACTATLTAAGARELAALLERRG